MKINITILKPNPTITEMFQYCNAPFENTRWSCGAVSVNNDIESTVQTRDARRLIVSPANAKAMQ